MGRRIVLGAVVDAVVIGMAFTAVFVGDEVGTVVLGAAFTTVLGGAQVCVVVLGAAFGAVVLVFGTAVGAAFLGVAYSA